MLKDSTLNKAIEYINDLDLSYLVRKMTDQNYFLPRWTEEDALLGLRLYKNFLILSRKYPEEIFVPSKEIDEFWHNHILATRQYHQDCEAIFGYYYHHDPMDRENNGAGPQELVALFEKTQTFYFKEFDEYL